MDILSQLFAAGRIELDDLEHRMELAVRAPTLDELDAILDDLRSSASRAVVPADADAPRRTPAPMGPDRPKGSSFSLAMLSGTIRKGRWFPAKRHRAVAVMGGIRLDFREAELEPGTTDVRLLVLMGGVEIIVPPDLDVEVDGFAIMGGLQQIDSHPGPLEGQRSRLRVHARVVMGGVEVKVRPMPGGRTARGMTDGLDPEGDAPDGRALDGEVPRRRRGGKRLRGE